jgi:hypothetical protein
MKVYTVRILDTVFADIGDIADYIVACVYIIWV